jgi:hypothetical protein
MSGAIKVTPLYYDPETGKSAPERPRRAREREGFVMVPMAWVRRLQRVKHAGTYPLAVHLLFKAWTSKAAEVTLSNIDAAGLGMPRRSKWRALGELERLGLVTVRRCSRRSPVVRLHETHVAHGKVKS